VEIVAHSTSKPRPIQSLIPADSPSPNKPSSAKLQRHRDRGKPATVFALQNTHKTAALPLRRRKSNESIGGASIRSIASIISQKPKPVGPPASLLQMPLEVILLIVKLLPQRDRHALMLTHPALFEPAADVLYHTPLFASTYRFAQFAHTVSHHEHYGDRVRILDVSGFTAVPQFEREPMAGWREWKFRSHDLYRARRPHRVTGPIATGPPIETPKRRPTRRRVLKRGHPPPNPFLEAWSLSRDIPLGGLCHAVMACRNLVALDISRVQLAVDFLVVDKDYPPSAWTDAIFVSDVPKSWTWKSHELRPIYNGFIIEQLRKLAHLERVTARNSVFLSTVMVRELVEGSASLRWVDFEGSGMEAGKAWARKGTKEEILAVIREMEKSKPRSPGGGEGGMWSY
jgi:hypothetical protein